MNFNWMRHFPGLSPCQWLAAPITSMGAAVILASIGWPAGLGSGAERPTLAYQFPVGEARVYKLEYSSSSASDVGALFRKQGASDAQGTPGSASSTSFETKVSGEFVATVLEEKRQTPLIAYRLHDPSVMFRVNGQEAASEGARLRSDLGREVFAQVTREGRVVSVRVDPQVRTLSRSFVLTLIAATQFVLPDIKGGGSPKWEVEEEDPNGRYLARYEVVESAAGGDKTPAAAGIRKTKVRYLKPPSQLAPGQLELPVHILPSGSMLGTFDLNAGRLVSLEGSESQIVEISDKRVASTETKLRLDFLRRQQLSRSQLDALRRANSRLEKTVAAIPLSWQGPEKESEEALQRQKLGAATLEDLLAELKRAEQSGMKPPGDIELFFKFRALVYLQPAVSEKLAGVIAEAQTRSLTMSMLAEALGAVGHPEAQAALVSVIGKRSEDVGTVTFVLPFLAAVASPTQVAEETLQKLAFGSSPPQISYAALLALGTMARNLLRRSPERAQGIVETIVNQFAENQEAESARRLLLALGNSGSPRALPVVRRYVAHPQPEVRVAAVGSLRFIESSDAEAMLLRALTEDAETTVRQEAANALGNRQMSPEAFRGQRRTFETDKDDSVRLALLDNLWNARKKFPEVLDVVRAAAAKDGSPEVRRKAQWLIGSN